MPSHNVPKEAHAPAQLRKAQIRPAALTMAASAAFRADPSFVYLGNMAYPRASTSPYLEFIVDSAIAAVAPGVIVLSFLFTHADGHGIICLLPPVGSAPLRWVAFDAHLCHGFATLCRESTNRRR